MKRLLCILAATCVVIGAISIGQFPACTPNPTPNGNGGSNGNGNANSNGAVNDDPAPPAQGGVPAERLQPADLTYAGAFRLPDEFNWGARGIAYRPADGGGAGTLLVTGFELIYDPDHPGEGCWDPSWDCSAFYGEVTIPTLATASNWEDLPAAALVTPLTAFDGGLVQTVHREYIYVDDIAYVPRHGTQTSAKLYGSINLWYAEGVVGENTFPTIWMADPSGANARGMFHVGPEETPYHGRKCGAYLFTVPAWYADQYLGGRTLVTGRSRGTPAVGTEPVTINGGTQGPALFAFAPFDTDNPTGNLDALPILYYRVAFPGCGGPNVGNKANCDYPDFTMCDEWSGGAFLDTGTRRAIVLAGYKGLGNNCYDEPPVECHDPCSDAHGYHCQPYERQVIFYDVHELGFSAENGQVPWAVVPYAIWRPEEFFLTGQVCANLGGMAFDSAGSRLFMVERGLGEGGINAAVVHVWTLE